jgi:hypothetical protein
MQCLDIVAKGAIPERTGMTPSSGQLTSIHPGGGAANVPRGWVEPRPLGPQPGINYFDALCIADDIKQRSKDKP